MHLVLQSTKTALKQGKGEGPRPSTAASRGKGVVADTTAQSGKGINMKDSLPSIKKKGPLSSAKGVKRPAVAVPTTKGDAWCSGKKKVCLVSPYGRVRVLGRVHHMYMFASLLLVC